MSKEKTAAFLVDCLSNIPKQKGKIKAVVDMVKDGLTHIANGGEWSRDEARAVADAARAADWPAADADWAAVAAADAADWAAADAAAWAAHWAAHWAVAAAVTADDDSVTKATAWVAHWAARAHPDPAKERARQAKVREKLGLNKKQEAD